MKNQYNILIFHCFFTFDWCISVENLWDSCSVLPSTAAFRLVNITGNFPLPA